MAFPPRGTTRRLGAVLLALVLAGLAFASLDARPVAAHAAFERSDPAPNAVLAKAPAEVRMRFTEPLEPAYTTAHLHDRSGALLPGVASRVDANDRHALIATLPAGLANGTYSVVWHNLSAADGHTKAGYFAFTVGTATDVGAVAAPTTGGSGGPPEWLRAVSRWLALLGLAAAVAVWPVWLFVLRPALPSTAPAGIWAERRLRRLAKGALLLALAGNVVALLVQAAAAAGSARLGAGLATTLTETRYGRLWLLRLGLLAAYAVALAVAVRWRRRSTAAVGLLLAGALPLPFSLISHASAQTVGRATAIAVDVVHLLGAAVWTGGLFVLAGALLPTLRRLPPAQRRVVLARAVPRFSAVALVAWGALALTGLYSAWLQVGNLDGLRETAYGRSLTIKLLLLAPLLLLGAVNLLVVGRGVRREPDAAHRERAGTAWGRRFALTVGAEVGLVVVVLLVVGRLIGQPPAREELAQSAPRAIDVPLALDTGGAVRPATLAISPGAAGPNDYRLAIGGDPLPTETEALLRLDLPSLNVAEPKELALARGDDNAFAASGAELGVAGDWTVELVLRRIGAFQWTATRMVGIETVPPPPADGLPGPPWHFDRAGVAGLLLLVLGVGGVVLAWAAGRAALRPRSAALGGAALAVGVIVLLQARLDPASAIGGVEPTSESARMGGPALASPVASPPARPSSVGPGRGTATAPTSAGTPVPVGAGTPAARAGLTVTLLPASDRAGPTTLALVVADESGGPIADAAVSVITRSLAMEMGADQTQATATAPGRYEAVAVPLDMAGAWQVTVRVARPGLASETFAFRLELAD